MFQLTSAGGMNLGFPDVCLTPTPVGPIPVPYPNMTTGATANPATTALTVLTDGMPSLNQMSMIPISNGDNAGVNMGVASGLVMGPTEFILGSLTVIKEGAPAQRLTSITGHNGVSMNAPGVALAPSQVTVLVLG
ncbi:MAG TPA: DUF4150 domain-containing protein [Syntrophales bacterium]|jgi:hypothetical protein|nr:DUF4150 domain-containing protein [Syntrophales bacterium]HOU77256.1 DUF4150 domain-containing protein [Syntrophales bacterium]HPC32687.1 DUF4150 domain-containing protein [Syntrophales bacterium]HQG34252.1 DUF4150 domain-containing protein [Syntrophales bacterium]HQI36779.1 DUF4150 domain-containing protein [Syntrophales bacterium]